MLHQGTISPKYKTAFVVNTNAYRTVSRGFTISIMDPSFTDDQVVDQAIMLLGVDAPNTDGGAGKAVKEIMEDFDASHYDPPVYIKAINEQIKWYNILHSRMILAIKNEGYFRTSWHLSRESLFIIRTRSRTGTRPVPLKILSRSMRIYYIICR